MRLLLLFVMGGCDSSVAVSADLAAAGCALTAASTATTTVENGCALRDREPCLRSGITGVWEKFSCRVAITQSGANLTLSSDSRPEHTSNYFPSTDACYEAYTTQSPNPNHIAAQAITVTVPAAPGGSGSAMSGGVVGLAVDGVAIFDNQAAPGDDIFDEVGTFDRCQGHPQMTGLYHYHSEPYAISQSDARLIGVMRDGWLIYGRLDADGSLPTLDANGGHTSVTPDSATPVYHYHAHSQSGSGGRSAWFLTTGTYAATPGACTGC